MSPGVLRERTARNLRIVLSTRGDNHPATWAAYGRAIAAWGNSSRVRSIAPLGLEDDDSLVVASLAFRRASSRPGLDNRHTRARRRAA